MEIINKMKKREEKQWHLGDVVEEEEGHKAMIVKDNEGDYVLMDIDPDCANAFQVSEFFECATSLKGLRELSYNWHKVNAKAGDRMTVATREKCPCCDFDSDGFGKNIIGKGYGSCEIRLYRATKYDFYIYSYSVGAEALLKDWFEIYSQKVRFCPVCGRRLAID